MPRKSGGREERREPELQPWGHLCFLRSNGRVTTKEPGRNSQRGRRKARVLAAETRAFQGVTHY